MRELIRKTKFFNVARKIKKGLYFALKKITFRKDIDPFLNHIQKTRSYWENAKNWHDDDGGSDSLYATEYWLDKFNMRYENIIGKEIEKFIGDKDFYFIDLGCSKGQFLFYINEKMSSNFRAPKKLFGIEINEETCNEAIKRALKLGLNNISFFSKYTIKEIIDSLALDKNTTLVITTIRTLVHFENENYLNFVEEIKKLNSCLLICSEHQYTSCKLEKSFQNSNINVIINKERPFGYCLTIINV